MTEQPKLSNVEATGIGIISIGCGCMVFVVVGLVVAACLAILL